MTAPCRIVHDVLEAAQMLAAGKVVAFPTETVYGLGADAANPDAVSRIFRIKGRPEDHPLIVHLAAVEQLSEWAQEIPDEAYLLAEQFWPGPLTLILRRDGRVSDTVTGGQNTVGLRVPEHPVALELLRRFGGGVAAPSANRFGRISPTTARHVLEELGDQLELIIDAGPSRIGLESTIVSLAGREPVLLRPGAISAEELEKALGSGRLGRLVGKARSRTPGMLPSHYAPLTSFRIMEQALLRETLQRLLAAGKKVVVMTFPARGVLVPDNIALQIMPENPAEYARELYAVMRGLDNGDYDCILADAPPDTPPWQAVRDRLYRAAG
jgi:L-threonylcarbamoyladenylate synthase